MKTAEELIDLYLGEARVSKQPYHRALDRIENLEKRGVDVVKHTMMRLNKTERSDKVEGIYWAAKDYGMSSVASAAKKKYKSITGHNPGKHP